MSIVVLFIEGRITKDPELLQTANDKTLCRVSVACDTGYGDYKSTLYFNCTAWGKTAEAIAQYCHKGDQIFIEGEPTQNKVDDKVYHGVNVKRFSFGAKKGSSGQQQSSHDDAPPFSDDDIPF